MPKVIESTNKETTPLKTKSKRVTEMNTTEILLGVPPEPVEDFYDDSPPSKREEYLDKVIKENFSIENIEVRTDLSAKQILVLSRAKLYASHFNMPILENFCNNIMVLSLSKDRKSRGELVNLSKAHLGGMDPLGYEPDPSISRRLFGG